MAQSGTIHGTLVAWHGKGVLILGPSGSGKSQLALALMGQTPPAQLVADDRVAVSCKGNHLLGSAPEALFGLIERFGMGIEHHAALEQHHIDLAVELVPRARLERLPEPAALIWRYEGIDVPKLILPVEPVNGPSAVKAFL